MIGTISVNQPIQTVSIMLPFISIVTPLTYGIETAELCFMALTAFAYSVLFFAVIIVIFMRSKRGFLEKTWVAYEEYKKIKQRQGENAGFSNIALEEI